MYIDNCIFFHKEKLVIGDAITSLKNPTEKGLSRFDFRVGEDYTGFLGIGFNRCPDGTTELI